VVISPQSPAISHEMHTQMKLSFDVLFDAGNQVAEAYGIAMQLPEDLIKVYASFGIDLPSFDGDDSWRLPVPARIVLAKGGAVIGIEADPDYTRRPEVEETLALLRTASDGAPGSLA
jgi:peroxiredoxin